MLEIKSKPQGAELTSIKYQGEEKLHQAQTHWNRHAPVLFPIVGQLKDGKTIINEKEYQMGQHGFARDMEFELIEKNETKHKYRLTSNDETRKKYPFNFILDITYTIKENAIETKYEVTNTNTQEITFGLGGHPAYLCDYTTGDYEIVFDKQEDNIKFMSLTNGLLDNENDKNLLENNTIHLTSSTFDNDAIIMKNITSNKITLRNKKEQKEILEFDFAGFPYLALWSQKGAPFVCIEPWQNTADKIDSNNRFEEKENICKLQPNKIFSCSYKVTFK